MTKRKEKHKQKFKERGITLIALVITIIVLLILAGVALSALTGDSGILNNAESAKEKTNLANAKEQVALAVQGARLENVYETGKMTISYANLKNELDTIIGNGKYEIAPEEEAGSWTVTVREYEVIVSKNGSVFEIPIESGTKPWLPDGFSLVDGTDLSNGLTITNATGLQNYVWIEVPTTISAEVNGTTVTLANAKDESEILKILEVYAGKGTATNYRDSSYKDKWYDGCGMTSSEYQKAYSSMLNSIKTYGGFWLAQYEAGISYEQGNRTKSSSRITNATSANYAKDQYPYNFVYCSEAQKIANQDSTEKYTSSLPFGIQWDLVCKFIEVKSAKTYDEIATNSTWGNYSNTYWISSANSKCSDDYGASFKSGTKEKSEAGSYILTTGAIESTKESADASPMNIYDFAGNLWEWTLEYTANQHNPCAYRGGYYHIYSYDYPAACRNLDYTAAGYSTCGFRSTLY